MSKKSKAKSALQFTNRATETAFGWMSGTSFSEGTPAGQAVWDKILQQMVFSEDNWLYTFDQSFARFEGEVVAAWMKELAEENQYIGRLVQCFVCDAMSQIDRRELGIALLKHSGRWEAYLTVMNCTAEEIENDPDAFVRATPMERARLEQVIAQSKAAEACAT